MEVLIGPDRKLRPLWRAIIFFILTFFALPMVLDPLAARFALELQIGQALTAGAIAFGELENFVVALIATALFTWSESRRVDSYGMPLERALGHETWEGVAAGTLVAAGVALGMYLLDGMQVHGFAITGPALMWSALAWAGTMVIVGIAEEFWFRAYFLQTLWKSIGFWPAAFVIAALFAAIHYFFKTGENIWDVITLVWFSLLICYSVLKTGTLWFAVGLHFAFDYMQFFVIGTPNGSQVPVGRMLDATFNGPAWLTGGVLGTEASFLMYPLLALLTLYVWWRFPARGEAAAPAAAAV